MIGLALGVEGSYLIVPFLATPQAGNSMVNAGLFDGDILVVDRAEQASHGRIVVAVIDGEMTVKRLYSQSGRVELRAENPAYRPIIFDEGRELTIWGVVIGSVRQFKA